MRTFPLISDAGHGWARVPRQVLNASGVSDQISAHSYQKGNNVFLEQDSDLPKFVEARNAAGVVTKFAPYNNKSRESRIRKYERYTPDSVPADVGQPE